MATETGVWDLQQVRDKQLAGEWSYDAQEPLSLYSYGYNGQGQLGLNNKTGVPGYTQLPGVWKSVGFGGQDFSSGVKTSGALFTWGPGSYGQIGNNKANADADNGYSSPKQMGTATDWNQSASIRESGAATKTTGELWMWGQNDKGALGQNDRTQRSLGYNNWGDWICLFG